MKMLHSFLHKFYDFKVSASGLLVEFLRSSSKMSSLLICECAYRQSEKNNHSHQLYDNNHCFCHHHYWKQFFRRCDSTHLLGIHVFHYNQTRCHAAPANILFILITCNFLMYPYHQTTIDKLHLFLPGSFIKSLRNFKKIKLCKRHYGYG